MDKRVGGRCDPSLTRAKTEFLRGKCHLHYTNLWVYFFTLTTHTKPLDCFASVLDGAEHHLGVEVVRQFADEL